MRKPVDKLPAVGAPALLVHPIRKKGLDTARVLGCWSHGCAGRAAYVQHVPGGVRYWCGSHAHEIAYPNPEPDEDEGGAS